MTGVAPAVTGRGSCESRRCAPRVRPRPPGRRRPGTNRNARGSRTSSAHRFRDRRRGSTAPAGPAAPPRSHSPGRSRDRLPAPAPAAPRLRRRERAMMSGCSASGPPVGGKIATDPAPRPGTSASGSGRRPHPDRAHWFLGPRGAPDGARRSGLPDLRLTQATAYGAARAIVSTSMTMAMRTRLSEMPENARATRMVWPSASSASGSSNVSFFGRAPSTR